MVLADTLSRSCPPGTDLVEDLSFDPLATVCSVVIRSEGTMEKYQVATAGDEELAVVRRYIKSGWPVERRSCASRALPYWDLQQPV